MSAIQENGNSKMVRSPRIVIVCLMLLTVVLQPATGTHAAPLGYFTSATLTAEAFLNWVDGRMGFGQGIGGDGTLNDFKADLGLLTDQQAYRLAASIRPLPHHQLRLYGSIPEHYGGGRILNRDLVTRNGTYAAGSQIESDMSYATFGFGYDLDFLVGPNYFLGLHGDLKYVHAQVKMWSPGVVGQEDVVTIDEMTPCLGAHVETKPTFFGNGLFGALCPTAFARMTYGITPNYLNYVDVAIGLGARYGALCGPSFGIKVGYEHESVFLEQELVTGRILQFKRNGVMISLEGTF
ncbi:hypothetical protein ACFL2Q_18425 [Thermodesulfobacteriota bacterium]